VRVRFQVIASSSARGALAGRKVLRGFAIANVVVIDTDDVVSTIGVLDRQFFHGHANWAIAQSRHRQVVGD
jgi:hypothetical protein